MRYLEVDILKCKLNKLTPDEYVFLALLYYKDFNSIKSLFGKDGALQLRNKLCPTKYILSDTGKLVTKTVISKKEVENLLNIKASKINFWEFYNKYPIKVGNGKSARALRAANPDAKLAKKHEKKYLSIVKSSDDHAIACKGIETYVESHRKRNSLQFLQHMDTVLNNCTWENYVSFADSDDFISNQDAI